MSSGGTRCLLAAGSIEDAASQLDFLHEISATTSRPAELMLLRAQVSAKQGVGEAEVLQHLNDAIEIRSSELEVSFLQLIKSFKLLFAYL